MSRIALLDQEVVNQIAAGEVVERPASVVKELLENAIDAGAGQITVEIKNAGLQEIKVIDNGTGMTGEEACLALKRHATSKINEISDLYSVETLGFRGEALTAITAVSRCTIITRTPDQVSGTRIVVEGGALKTVEPVGCPSGTQIIVQDLFFNTLPRRKFLKSARTEAGTISDLVSRFALGYPELSFRYYSGKRLIYATNGQGDPREVFGILYGQEAARHFLKVSCEEEGIKLEGYVSRPELTRSTRYYQSFFVNRRLVYNTHLNRALENAYWGLITKGHFPLSVIYLSLDPAGTDVNVHPTKRDIRFGNPALITRVVQQGIRSALISRQFRAFAPFSTTPGHVTEIKEQPKEQSAGVQPVFHDRRIPFTVHEKETSYQDADSLRFQDLRVIGQAQATYIIAERGEEVFFIDQHAAHERVRYETIKDQRHRKALILQKTVVGLEFRLTPEERGLYEEHKQIIAGLGYTLKEVKDNAFYLLTVPSELREDPKQFFFTILDLLREAGQPESLDVAESAITLFACKSSIKAGDVLNMEEMRQLLVRLDATQQPDHCPHGRPTYLKITNPEFAKRFNRI